MQSWGTLRPTTRSEPLADITQNCPHMNPRSESCAFLATPVPFWESRIGPPSSLQHVNVLLCPRSSLRLKPSGLSLPPGRLESEQTDMGLADLGRAHDGRQRGTHEDTPTPPTWCMVGLLSHTTRAEGSYNPTWVRRDSMGEHILMRAPVRHGDMPPETG